MPLQQGKMMIYEAGTLYASIFPNKIHQIDCFTHQVKVFHLQDIFRLLTAVKFAKYDEILDEAIYNAGFLLYYALDSSLILYVSSEKSRQLKPKRLGLTSAIGLPRDLYNCNIIKFTRLTFLIFQRKNQISYFKLETEK